MAAVLPFALWEYRSNVSYVRCGKVPHQLIESANAQLEPIAIWGKLHVRVATVQIQPGKMQEAIDIYNNSVVPAAKT
ncbi:MAG: hypothetical protein IH963_15150 [Chloroflexi bacterium]|nr:hypothetical protein [Chloroflexota bacterium]